MLVVAFYKEYSSGSGLLIMNMGGKGVKEFFMINIWSRLELLMTNMWNGLEF